MLQEIPVAGTASAYHSETARLSGRPGRCGGGWKRGDDMLKQTLVLGASLLLPAIAAASDFRTLSHGGTPARSMQVNIAEIDRRVAEPPYALTGKSERQEWRV